MTLTKLYDPKDGILNIVGLMSGAGTNLRKVIEYELKLAAMPEGSPYHVCAIFSDNACSSAPDLGRDYNLPVVIRDIGAFYKTHGFKKRDLCLRPTYDAETVRALSPYNSRFAVYAGYMSIASNVLIEAFTGINVHPGDLTSIRDGKRLWTGDNAVLKAILAGETSLKSTTHLIEPAVDCGRILMLSKPVHVSIPKDLDLTNPDLAKATAADYQNRLKQYGDWEILPRTIEFIASGRYAHDESGDLYFDSRPIPEGVKL
jgi:folate-dependent phosphoribosylglycinamide formyltransferase PurN